jgi:hypothetical protein
VPPEVAEEEDELDFEHAETESARASTAAAVVVRRKVLNVTTSTLRCRPVRPGSVTWDATDSREPT